MAGKQSNMLLDMTSEILGPTVVARGEGWLTAWVGQEYVMMSAETGTCISLSETGGRTWELLEEPQSVAAVCQTLSSEYDADPAIVSQDVLQFLINLRAEGAVVVVEPAAG